MKIEILYHNTNNVKYVGHIRETKLFGLDNSCQYKVNPNSTLFGEDYESIDPEYVRSQDCRSSRGDPARSACISYRGNKTFEEFGLSENK